MFEAHHLDPEPCPNCGHMIDACTGLQGKESPDPGDVTICMYCGALLRYGEGLSLIKLSPENAKKLCDENPLLAKLVMVYKEIYPDGLTASREEYPEP